MTQISKPKLDKRVIQKLLNTVEQLPEHCSLSEEVAKNYLLIKDSGFPISSYLLLIQSRTDRRVMSPDNLNEGWVDVSYEKKISDLEKELHHLKNAKVLFFPKLDKKWKTAFNISALVIGAFLIIFFVFIQKIGDDSVALDSEKQANYEKAEVIAKQEQELINIRYTTSLEIQSLRDSVTGLRLKLRNQMTLLNQRESQITEIDRKLSRSKEDTRTLNLGLLEKSNEIRKLQREKDILRKETETLSQKLKSLSKINFSLGISAVKTDHCKGSYEESEELTFSAFENMVIRSIKVKPRKAGFLNVVVKDGNGRNVCDKRVYVEKGIQTVSLDFKIPKGYGYRLQCTEGKLFSLKDCTYFPYSVTGLISISSPDRRCAFFDWIVSVNT